MAISREQLAEFNKSYASDPFSTGNIGSYRRGSMAGGDNSNNSDVQTTQKGNDDTNWAQKVLDDMNAGRIIWDDNLRAKANEILRSANKTSDPVDSFLQTAIDTYTKQHEEYVRKYNEFDKNNPFDWDKVLEEEKAKATQRLDPYYTQTLNDFLTGINTKRARSAEDERNILNEINADTDYYKGESAKKLNDAIISSNEGFADSGLLNSGKALRSEGRLTADSNTNMDRYMSLAEREKQKTLLSGKRLNEDLTLEEQMKRRDLAQERGYNIETGALTGRNQRFGKWQFEKGQYTGADAGVNPMLYNNSLYSFLS